MTRHARVNPAGNGTGGEEVPVVAARAPCLHPHTHSLARPRTTPTPCCERLSGELRLKVCVSRPSGFLIARRLIVSWNGGGDSCHSDPSAELYSTPILLMPSPCSLASSPLLSPFDAIHSAEKSETHPHPAAPAEIADDFPKFQKTLESGPHFDANKLQPFEEAAKEYQVGMRKEDVEAQKRGGTSAPSEGGVDGSAGGSRSGQGAKEAGSGSGSGKGGSGEVKEGTVEDLHDLPPRFWKTATLVMDEAEMEAIMVSLQTVRRS